MTLYEKLKWVMGVLLVFLLIVGTNLLDRDNFNRIKNSIETIYQDRLVAEKLVFDMYSLVHEMELSTVCTDGVNDRFTANRERMNILIEQFSETQLTSEEEIVFARLQQEADDLMAVQPPTGLESRVLFEPVKESLKDLSNIQLKEGQQQLSISKKAMNTVELFTQIEIYLLVALALTIQVVVMYQPSKRRQQSED